MFSCWQDAEMTIPFTGINAVFTYKNNKLQNEPITGVFYFGNPDASVKLQDAVNPSVNPIVIKPDYALSEPPRGEYIHKDEVYKVGAYIYKVIQGGTTDAELPTYQTGIGSEIFDGQAVLQCIYKSHTTAEVKLALSANGLNTAIAGGAVQLGTEIIGGVGIAIYYQITNSNSQSFNTLNNPQLCLSISEVIETGV